LLVSKFNRHSISTNSSVFKSDVILAQTATIYRLVRAASWASSTLKRVTSMVTL